MQNLNQNCACAIQCAIMCKTKNNKNINKIVQNFVQTRALYERLNYAVPFWSYAIRNETSIGMK